MLTDSQKATLHSDMLAMPELATAIATGDDIAIATYYNQPAVPDFYVWRTSVPPADYLNAIVWTEVDSRSAAQARIWEWMTLNNTAYINPSKPNIMDGINNAFAGTGAAGTRTALVALCKRKASIAERLFATGTGSQAVPATMGWEGPMSYIDASDARAWGG